MTRVFTERRFRTDLNDPASRCICCTLGQLSSIPSKKKRISFLCIPIFNNF